MRQRENQRVMLTRRLLEEALLDLMEEKPLSQIGVSELCKRACINRTTFYNHYGSPADVFAEIERDTVRELRERLDAATPAGEELTLGRRVEVLCSYLRSHERFSKLLFMQAGDNSNFLEALLQMPEGQPEAVRNSAMGYDTETLALLKTFLAHGIYALVRKWVLEDVPKTPQEIGQLAERVALRGWAARQG